MWTIKLEAVTMLIFLAGATVFSMSVTGGLNRTPARCKRYDTEISGNRGRMKTRHPGIDCWFLVFVTTGNEWPCLLCELERLARSQLKFLMALDGGNSGNQANQPKVQSCRIQRTPLFDIGKVYDHTEARCLGESANLARDNCYRPEK